MAPALLDLRGGDDDLVGELAERALRLAGHEPDRPVERTRSLEGQRRPALVAEHDEHVGLPRREHELQRLLRPAACLRRVKRGSAARVQHAACG